MCGLCGSFTQQGTVLSKRDRTTRARVVESLLLANQMRGTDSTGIAAIGFDGSYDIFKRAVRAGKFVDQEQVAKLLRLADRQLLIGHTRMTSMGNDVTDQNAHPFVEGNVVGAHNGVINNYTQIDASVRVDSQAVFRLLDANPDEYEEAFTRISGSCALTWWDRRNPDTFYLIAHQNPLSVAIVPRINTMYWSSMEDHLESAMRVAYGREALFIPIRQDIIYRFDGNNIYEWAESEVDFYQYYTASHYKGYPLVIKRGSEDTPGDWELGSNDPKSEADRYDEYWEGLIAREEMDRAALIESDGSESDDENENSLARPQRVHDVPVDGPMRFGIDDLDGTLECGYCERPLGEGGAWDDGLTMLLCRYCQNWWDQYGHYTEEGQKLMRQAYTALTS